jgi:hypothetical protein
VNPAPGAGGGGSVTAPNVVDECLARWLAGERRRWKEMLLRSGIDRFYPLRDIHPTLLALKDHCGDKVAWRGAQATYDILDVEGSSAHATFLDIYINAVYDPVEGNYKQEVMLVRRLLSEVEREYAMREKLIVTRTGKNIYVGREGEKIVVHGDTFPVKDELKKKGFKWDPLYKVWYKPAKDADLDRLYHELEVL